MFITPPDALLYLLHRAFSSVFSSPSIESGVQKAQPEQAIVNTIDENSPLSQIDACENEVLSAYENFCIKGKYSVNLSSVTAAIQRFESFCLVEQNSSEAEKLQYRLKEMQSMAATMNAKSSPSQLTLYDVDGFGTFLKTPQVNFYFDKSTGKKYIQPDHSQLLKIGGDICIKGTYAGIGLSRHVKLKEQICDILYLNKRKDQISAENPFFQTSFFNNDSTTINDRISTQRGLAMQLYPMLKEKITEWNYETFLFCDKKEILEYTQDKSLAKKSHAILFFYKQVSNEKE